MTIERKRRWSLATLIFLVTALLIMLVVGLSVGVGVLEGRRFADAAVEEALDRGAVTQLDFERLRAREIELIAEGLAKDENFVAYIEDALGTDDLFGDGEVDRVSIADQLSERGAELDLDVAILLDADGEVVARTDRQVRPGKRLDDDPLVAELVADLTPLSAIWRDGEALYQVAMQPLDKAFNLIGFLLVGSRIDGQLADEMKRATGADQVWLTSDAVAASTLTAAATERVLAELRQEGRLESLLAGGGSAYRLPLRIDRGRWIASVEPVAVGGAVVSLLSLDTVLASHRRLWIVLIAVGLGAVLLGLGLSLALSRRVVRPLAQLAAAATAASKGDYQQEFEASGSEETERLGGAFASLLSDLREKRDIEEYVADLSRYLPDPAVEQGATSRATPALGRPERGRLTLLALDYRHLVNLDSADSAEENVRRFQSNLSQIAALAEALEARLESFSGHRALVGFRGDQGVDHALEFAGHVAEHASESPSMALVLGVVDRGMVRAGMSTAEVLIGKASHQVDLLLEEARPGNLLLTPAIKRTASSLLGSLDIECGVQAGRLTGRKYHALDSQSLTRLAAAVSDQTRQIDPGVAETVIDGAARTREIVPGDVFAERFEIISVLGQGGMGMVYKALDRELEDFVALKSLLPELAGDESYLQQLKEEIKLARRITHPNVLRTFDFGSHEGVAYISMEYVRGMTLRYLMRQRSRLPYSAGLRISRQTCAGLAAAHSQDVIHRDIKPENIILKANGNAKLMDFGIARPAVADRDEGIGVFIGTACYAAPEQMEGKRVEASADVYAFGVLLYELFTGVVPCRQRDVMELYTAKKHQDFASLDEAWSGAPEHLNSVVMKCLSADPGERYRDAAELGQALASLRAIGLGAALLAVVPLVAPDQAADETAVEYFLEARLRAETMTGIPGGRELERARLHATLGARWFPAPSWELGAALKLAAGSDENRDNARNLDNEESNEVELSEVYLRLFPTEHGIVEAGRTALPLGLSPMLWDHDLRPSGVSFQQDFAVRAYDRLSLTGGWFTGLHIDETDTELAAAQLDWRLREGAPSGGGVTLTYLHFADLDGLIADGRGRSNANAAGAYLNDYELLDLQLSWRWPLPFAALTAEVDLVENLGADDANRGARLTLVLGDSRDAGGWEFGYSIQRVQREAVVAAFNEDDWWFPSRMRGFMPWIGYGISDSLRLRLAAFRERLDGRDEHFERLQLDLVYTR